MGPLRLSVPPFQSCQCWFQFFLSKDAQELEYYYTFLFAFSFMGKPALQKVCLTLINHLDGVDDKNGQVQNFITLPNFT